MPRPNVISQAAHDLIDDVAYHAVNLANGALELVCLLAVGMVVYASSIDSANAGLSARPMFGVQASIDASLGVAVNADHAPSSCSLTNDLLPAAHRTCITALVLEPYGI